MKLTTEEANVERGEIKLLAREPLGPAVLEADAPWKFSVAQTNKSSMAGVEIRAER